MKLIFKSYKEMSLYLRNRGFYGIINLINNLGEIATKTKEGYTIINSNNEFETLIANEN